MALRMVPKEGVQQSPRKVSMYNPRIVQSLVFKSLTSDIGEQGQTSVVLQLEIENNWSLPCTKEATSTVWTQSAALSEPTEKD